MKTLIYTLLLFPALLCGQWADRSTPQLGGSYFVYFINDSVGFKGKNQTENVHKTVNGGWDWSLDTSDYRLFRKAVFINHNEGFAIGFNEAYRTTDGGQNWQVVTDTFAISEFFNLEERNGTVVLNGENNGQYYWYVFDSASGWTMRHSTTTESPKICFILDENHFYGVHQNFERIFYSSDGGLTWRVDSLNMGATDPTVSGLYFTTPDTGILVHTNKMGATSTVIKTYTGIDGILNPNYFTKTYLPHATNFVGGYGEVVCAGGGDGMFHCSPDLGEHWFDQDVTTTPGFMQSLFDIYFISEDHIVTGGYSDRLLVTLNGIQHSLQTESHIHESDVSVYPNPSNGNFYIELPPEDQWTMTLINATGQTVLQQNIRNSIENVQAEHLAKGVYVLRLTSERGSVSKRVVVK